MTFGDPSKPVVKPTMTHFFYMDKNDPSKVSKWYGAVGFESPKWSGLVKVGPASRRLSFGVPSLEKRPAGGQRHRTRQNYFCKVYFCVAEIPSWAASRFRIVGARLCRSKQCATAFPI